MTAPAESEAGVPVVPKSTEEVLRDAIKRQYHAALRMLKLAVELCPDDLWYPQPEEGRAFWRTAYHALFYTHLYLELRDDSLDSSQLHQSGIQDIDDVPLPPDLDETADEPRWPPQAHRPMSKAEVLEYWRACDDMVDAAVDRIDLIAIEDGFHWDNPPLPPLMQQVDAIRHLQHHTSQLCGRLEFVGRSVEWVSVCQPRVLDAIDHLEAEATEP